MAGVVGELQQAAGLERNKPTRMAGPGREAVRGLGSGQEGLVGQCGTLAFILSKTGHHCRF